MSRGRSHHRITEMIGIKGTKTQNEITYPNSSAPTVTTTSTTSNAVPAKTTTLSELSVDDFVDIEVGSDDTSKIILRKLNLFLTEEIQLMEKRESKSEKIDIFRKIQNYIISFNFLRFPPNKPTPSMYSVMQLVHSVCSIKLTEKEIMPISQRHFHNSFPEFKNTESAFTFTSDELTKIKVKNDLELCRVVETILLDKSKQHTDNQKKSKPRR